MSQSENNEAETGDVGGSFRSPGLELAARLEADIVATGAVVGSVVASARELREMSAAGRPVVQQAVRILQERGVAYMRRGAGGGLVVAPPSATFAARALSIELERGASVLEALGPFAFAVETDLYLDGAARAPWENLEELRRLAQRLDGLPSDEFERADGFRQLWLATRVVEGGPVPLLVGHTSFEVTVDTIPFSIRKAQFVGASQAWRDQMNLVEALACGDIEGMFDCRRRLLMMFEGHQEWLDVDRDPSKSPVIGDDAVPQFHGVRNRADSLVREIIREIRLLNWRPGARIASGVELMERYRVGADILRQAILLLQEHGAVSVEKGRRGGLYVAGSNRPAALRSAQDYLTRSRATGERAASFLTHLVTEAYDGYPQPDVARLSGHARELLAADARGQPDLWTLSTHLCRNDALDLFVELFRPLVGPAPMAQADAETLLQVVSSGDYARGRWLLLRALRQQSRDDHLKPKLTG